MNISNNESNNEKQGQSSPEWRKNMGRLRNIPIEERRKIARKGGLAKSERKRLSSQLNPIKTGNSTSIISIAKCNECPINHICGYYKKDSACSLELNIRRNALSQFKAIAGSNPDDMLKEMSKAYFLLEEEVHKNPTLYNLSQLMYLLMHIYEMKFRQYGKTRKGINISIQSESNEVKKLMKELRDFK
jgi:hypothetical protein